AAAFVVAAVALADSAAAPSAAVAASEAAAESAAAPSEAVAASTVAASGAADSAAAPSEAVAASTVAEPSTAEASTLPAAAERDHCFAIAKWLAQCAPLPGCGRRVLRCADDPFRRRGKHRSAHVRRAADRSALTGVTP